MASVLPSERTPWITAQARAIGFDLCGVAAPDALAELEHVPAYIQRPARRRNGNSCAIPGSSNPGRALEGIRSA